MQTTIHYPKLRFGKKYVDIFPYWIGSSLAFYLDWSVRSLFPRAGLQVTGLSNKVPWGLWISIDLSSISLGGSAFVFGVIVYLLRIKRFEIVGKLAVLLGFLGYSTAGMVLLFDLGQPLRFWHPIVFWQVHSLLWEITMCVVLYLTVLVAELLPVIVELPFFEGHPLHEKYPIIKESGGVGEEFISLAAQDRTRVGGHWVDPFPFAPSLPRSDLLRSLWTRRLVQSKRSHSVRVLCNERRHCASVLHERDHLPCDAPGIGKRRCPLRRSPHRWRRYLITYLPASLGLGGNQLLFL